MNLFSRLGKIADELLDENLQDLRRATERPKRGSTLTLDTCIQKAYAEQKKYPQIIGFIITLTRGGASDEDGLEITVAYLDRNRKAIALDNETALADTYRVTTVDEKLVNLLDGNTSAIYELDKFS